MKRMLATLFLFFVHSTWTMEYVPKQFADLPDGVQAYLKDLPKIKKVADDADAQVRSTAIVDYLLNLGGYEDCVDGRDVLQKKILRAIQNTEPLVRIMPAFPVASPNAKKIPFDDKHAFSLGDLVALLTQNHISHEIKKIYAPGSSSAIYWEPFLVDVNETIQKDLGHPFYTRERIASYQKTLHDMVTYLNPYVTIGTIPSGTLDEVYHKKYREFPIMLDMDNAETKDTIANYTTFWKEQLDDTALKQKMTIDLLAKGEQKKKIPEIINIRIKDAAKQVAETAYVGSKREAIMLEKEIPEFDNMIRQSVRPDMFSVAKKIGTPMIYHSYQSSGTPWHNVLVVKPVSRFHSGSVELKHYKEVEKKLEDYPLKGYTIDGHELNYYSYEPENQF